MEAATTAQTRHNRDVQNGFRKRQGRGDTRVRSEGDSWPRVSYCNKLPKTCPSVYFLTPRTGAVRRKTVSTASPHGGGSRPTRGSRPCTPLSSAGLRTPLCRLHITVSPGKWSAQSRHRGKRPPSPEPSDDIIPTRGSRAGGVAAGAHAAARFKRPLFLPRPSLHPSEFSWAPQSNFSFTDSPGPGSPRSSGKPGGWHAVTS